MSRCSALEKPIMTGAAYASPRSSITPTSRARGPGRWWTVADPALTAAGVVATEAGELAVDLVMGSGNRQLAERARSSGSLARALGAIELRASVGGSSSGRVGHGCLRGTGLAGPQSLGGKTRDANSNAF